MYLAGSEATEERLPAESIGGLLQITDCTTGKEGTSHMHLHKTCRRVVLYIHCSK